MRKTQITYPPQFNSLNIQNSLDGYYTKQLSDILLLFLTALSRHNKVLFARFDVRFPANRNYPEYNAYFKRFIASFLKYLVRKKYEPFCFWGREQKNVRNHHYHCMLLLNGSVIQNVEECEEKAKTLWRMTLNNFVENVSEVKRIPIHWCKSYDKQRQLMMRRGEDSFEEQFRDCFNWASYIAKVDTKVHNLGKIKTFGKSIIRKQKLIQGDSEFIRELQRIQKLLLKVQN